VLEKEHNIEDMCKDHDISMFIQTKKSTMIKDKNYFDLIADNAEEQLIMQSIGKSMIDR
jgi:hypothetical protein